MLTSFSVVPFQVERDAGIEMGFIQIRRHLKRLPIQGERIVLLAFAVQFLALLQKIRWLGSLRAAKGSGEKKEDECAEHRETSETKIILLVSGRCARGEKSVGSYVSGTDCRSRHF